MAIPDETKNYIDREISKLSKDIKDIMYSLEYIKKIKSLEIRKKYILLFSISISSLVLISKLK